MDSKDKSLKIAWRWKDWNYFVWFNFYFQIEYQPAKKVSELGDILKISESKKEFKFICEFVPTKKVFIKKDTEGLVPNTKIVVKTVW